MSMYRKTLMAGIAAMALVSGYGANPNASSSAVADESSKTDLPKALSFKMNTLEGEAADLSKYAGKVVMFVNVASKCGYTGQYDALQKLNVAYKDKGLVIVGVPCNQFGSQEAGTSKEIRNFCTSKYKVSFDMMEKVNVKDAGSEKACDLFKYLSEQDAKPLGKGAVKWNFEKFVLDRKGNLVGRFNSGTEPDSPEVIKLIEASLAK
ncbi:MAG: redoxin domain-containing protein [Planctomycetota bacterium]|jgi:glutathione peroxidase|nr:redoxin domain-containing protein [Planctomycetota bacterium]